MQNDVRIRPITVDDTNNIIKWRNSEAVMKNFIYRKRLTKNDHLKWIKNRINKKEVYQFVAEDIKYKKEFGSTYIKDVDKNNKKAELGIFIGEDSYRGKGYGTKLIELTTDYAFKKLKLNKIYARILYYNKPSYNAFIRCGYKKDAVLRDDVLIGRKYYDVIIMSKLKNDK